MFKQNQEPISHLRDKGLVVGLFSLLILSSAGYIVASDHDDGENEYKERNLNLTDLYVFREDQEITGGSPDHLILAMNSNPRSVARQQYYFSDQARYEIHIGQAGTDNQGAPRTNPDITLRAEFSAPDDNGHQAITMTTIKNGVAAVTSEGLSTTVLADSEDITNTLTIDGAEVKLFAGLRQDPFFFDVNKFFEARAAAAGAFIGGDTDNVASAFLDEYTKDQPVNFTADYNVNSIVLRVPIAWLQTNGETVFDVWTTISVPQAL